MTHLDNVVLEWQIPDLPAELGVELQDTSISSVARLFEQRLADEAHDCSPVQIAIADWLYIFVRRNVKRGRAFELEEVLASGQADCLGYAKLFAALGDKFGLELGIVEVLVDNMGRYVPHHVNLLNPDDGSHRFLDAWYGSTNINHRRFGALVNDKPVDVDREELSEIEDLKGLPERCIEAITLYIRGNRSLERGELDAALKLYSEAIILYPNNTRAYYNRALVHDRMGALEDAKSDYAKAFRDEAGVIRVLARVDELEPLIKLDEKDIGEEKQNIYLWYKGFKTGVTTSNEEIARQFKLSPDSVKQIIAEVESYVSGD